jgi:hypothetical protein
MISKRVLLIAVALLAVSATGAMAASVAVQNFNVNTLDIYAGNYLDIAAGTPVEAKYGIVKTDAYAKINGYLSTGWNSGSWDGDGIRSSYAAGLSPVKTVGIWTGDQWVNYGGHPDVFNGVTGVLPTWNLIQPTDIGDADGDGMLTGSDYAWIDAAWEGGYAGNATPWALGDFDHDGLLTGSDYAWIDAAWGFLYPSAAGAAVPEPSSIAMIVVGLMSALSFVAYRRAK